MVLRMTRKYQRSSRIVGWALLLVFVSQCGLLGILRTNCFETDPECVHGDFYGLPLRFAFGNNECPPIESQGFFSSGKCELFINGKLMDVNAMEIRKDSTIVYAFQDDEEEQMVKHIYACQLSKDVMVYDKKKPRQSNQKIFCPETDLKTSQNFFFPGSRNSSIQFGEKYYELSSNGREGPPPESSESFF